MFSFCYLLKDNDLLKRDYHQALKDKRKVTINKIHGTVPSTHLRGETLQTKNDT